MRAGTFKTDVLIIVAIGFSFALLIYGVKTDAPIASGLSVLLAAIATIVKMTVARKDRRDRVNPSPSDAPRRRSDDREHDHVAISR